MSGGLMSDGLMSGGLIGLHGRVVKGVGRLGHDEATKAGGHEFDPRPGH